MKVLHNKCWFLSVGVHNSMGLPTMRSLLFLTSSSLDEICWASFFTKTWYFHFSQQTYLDKTFQLLFCEGDFLLGFGGEGELNTHKTKEISEIISTNFIFNVLLSQEVRNNFFHFEWSCNCLIWGQKIENSILKGKVNSSVLKDGHKLLAWARL